ncbi:Serine/threonine protein kinase [Streptomyces sp. WMMB 714]|jgi:serine/threonine protein kinase|uniref:serine/threonine-protein kinase n=1 Tax=Streptomyces sp. WMMB 714 TaxID=1286822 RepID=UPI0005F88550|nr:serine/threonine-protein kinase [Streptomyces sp. WMMB 714]SCK25221.1 Serine/threonine protein kinase [Streptomyces sp. WMMB 714]
MAQLAADDPHSVGGYRLLSKLGAGGMGSVYLARSGGGRTVAVKLIKAELAAEPEFRSRFRLEVEAARRVGERWTAPVLDADTEAETPWVATGYIAGPSLEQVISSRVQQGHGPLPENSVRTLAYGLASALLDIHGAGVVHRDLKPSNVLVTIDGPRVIDFGIVRALDALPDSTMTNTGVVVGSPSYMSPEQIRAQQVTPASDVFCMGSVLAFAATGRPPFGSTSGGMHAVMFNIATEDPDLEGVEEPLRGLIASCLAKDPADRPAPEDVIAGVQPISTGTAAAPWLPATLIAELGRHAVQLLDTDTPPSGSGAPSGVPGAESGQSGSTSAPRALPEDPTSALPQPAQQQAPAPSSAARSRRRYAAAGAAAVIVAGAAFFASGAELPLVGSDEPGQTSGSSDIPDSYVGTWSGPVVRDGEPTGQYRRFTISRGKVGEVVANSFSLGTDYECKSDAKLVSVGKSLELDTRVIKSVGRKCSALGSHTVTSNSDSTLTWQAAGRSATLKRVEQPEKLPEEYVGTWQRQLPDGGTQRVTIEQLREGSPMSVAMVSESSTLHCEAKADIFSAGGDGEPVRLGPPLVDKEASSGECRTGPPSTLSVENGSMLRSFTEGGTEFDYTPAQ